VGKDADEEMGDDGHDGQQNTWIYVSGVAAVALLVLLIYAVMDTAESSQQRDAPMTYAPATRTTSTTTSRTSKTTTTRSPQISTTDLNPTSGTSTSPTSVRDCWGAHQSTGDRLHHPHDDGDVDQPLRDDIGTECRAHVARVIPSG